MSIVLSGTVIQVSGAGRIEDAETLVTLLQAEPGRAVDLTQAGKLHAAVVQALLAFRPAVLGPAGDPFVAAWLMPLLDGGAKEPAVVAETRGVAETSIAR